MSKIDKDLGLDDMLGMLDADRTIASKQLAPQQVTLKKNNIVLEKKLAPTSSANNTSANSQNETVSLDSTNEHTISVIDQEEKPDKAAQIRPPKKEKAVTTISKKKQPVKQDIFTLLNNFNKVFTRGAYFTSVRILKEKMKYLKLLFPGKSNIEIIDTLITDCLLANRAKLKERRKAYYDAKL